MPNSTTTVTFTGTVTKTVQGTTISTFGIPPELLIVGMLAAVAVVFLVFKFQVKGVPVQLVWIYKNGSAVMLRAKEDLQGIFLDIVKGNKKVEILKKTGLPLQVRYTPGKFKAYMDVPKGTSLEEPEFKALKEKGYTLTPSKADSKGRIKGYLVQKEASVEKALAYLDVNLGGLKTARLYAAIEGTGETIDWQPRVQKATGEGSADPGNTILLQEMRSAAKGFFQLLAEAMQGSIKTFLIPLVAGVGIGGMLVVMVFLLTGHVR